MADDAVWCEPLSDESWSNDGRVFRTRHWLTLMGAVDKWLIFRLPEKIRTALDILALAY